MLRLRLVPVLVLFAALAAPAQTRRAPARASHAPVARPSIPAAAPIVAHRLANGLEVLVLEDHSVPLVTVECGIKMGSIVETRERSGLSHVLEHMFFKSNRGVEAGEDYLKTIDQLGISFNATTKEEVATAYFVSTTPNFPVTMRFLRDALRYPTFDPTQVESEAQVVLGEADRQESNPYGVLNNTVLEQLFGAEAFRKRPMGDRQVVSRASPQQLRAMHDEFIIPNNTTIVVTGDVLAGDVFSRVESLFGDWQRAPQPKVDFGFQPLARSSGSVQTGPVSNAVIELAWQGPSLGGPETEATYAADVFSFILRQPNSRWQKALVDSNLAAGADLVYYSQHSTGPIMAMGATSPENARALLKAMYAEIQHFGDADYFSDAELENAKVLLAADDLFDREKPTDYADVIAFWWASAGVEYLNAYQQNLRKVTRADITRYLKTYILGKPHIGVVLLPPEAQKQLRLTAAEVAGQ
jgi:zinc protease